MLRKDRKGPVGFSKLEAIRPLLGGCPVLRGVPAPLPDSWEPGVESEVCSPWLLMGEATRAEPPKEKGGRETREDPSGT